MDNAKGKANQAQQKAKEVLGLLGNTITMSGCPVGSLDQWRSDQWVISPILINVVYWGYNPLIRTIDPNFQRKKSMGNQPTRVASWGYNPLILTFDPNFQRDIQVGITDITIPSNAPVMEEYLGGEGSSHVRFGGFKYGC